MRVSELKEKIERQQYRKRIFGALLDTLAPYLHRDIGSPERLEIAGCSLPFVPIDSVREVYDEVLEIYEAVDEELKRIDDFVVDDGSHKQSAKVIEVAKKKDTDDKHKAANDRAIVRVDESPAPASRKRGRVRAG